MPIDDASVVAAAPLRLRGCRERRNLTLAAVAGQIGVSVTHMSRLERGQRQPSIGVLLQLAALYQIGVGELIGEKPAPNRKLVRAGSSGRHESPDGIYTTLSGLARSSGLVVLQFDLRQGGSKQVSSHDDEEWMYVLEGCVDVHLGEEQLTLNRGDCLHFDARTPHRLTSSTATVTRLLIVSVPLHASRRNGHV